MKLHELQDKNIVILGQGIEGKSSLMYLKHFYPQKEIAIIDNVDNSSEPLQFLYNIAIKSPGIHSSNVKIPYTTATNIFFANVLGATIGITGSKGKSTTSLLIYEFLKQAGKKVHLVGNITHKLDPIGSPMLSELIKHNSIDDIWVCELSSFQLSDITYSPHISVITSFFPEHMDYHGSVENYWNAKRNIIAYTKPTDYLIYNQKFPKLVSLAKEAHLQTVPFIKNIVYSKDLIPLQGEHNMDNLRGAITVAKLFGLSDEIIINALKIFKPLPHRLENIGSFQNITFYDDAISTTPESAIQAIQTLRNIGTIFLGGQDRGFDFSELAEVISLSPISNLVLFPDSGDKIYQKISQLTDKSYRILHTSNMEEAVKFAYQYTPKGTICILSTASPSYTVWKNFEEKGNLFKRLVKKFATSSFST